MQMSINCVTVMTTVIQALDNLFLSIAEASTASSLLQRPL